MLRTLTAAAVVTMLASGLPVAAPAQPACSPLADRQLAAQLVMAPLPGPHADPLALEIARSHAGGVVLLGRNVSSSEQVRALLARLRQEAPLPLDVAVDEEGGRVARLGQAGVVPHLPSARTLAATATPEEVEAHGHMLGAALADLGITWNLAPVLDVTDAPASTVIGDRSYSADPEVAGSYAAAFARGLRAAGIATAGKHFPGHGRTTVDSHVARPVVEATRAELEAHDLLPYRIAAGNLDGVMLAHLLVPDVDPNWPTSLSSAAIAWLRHALAFSGVVMTDDLSMRAVAEQLDQPAAAVQAIRAGADLALVGTPEAAAPAADALASALADGSLEPGRAREAARRVLSRKGLPDADITCLLGLPPVAVARAARTPDGAVWWIDDGRARPVPDAETATALRLDPQPYAAAEVAALPAGSTVPTARRVTVGVVGVPGSDPADVARARAALTPGSAARAVVVADPVTPLGLAAVALAGAEVPVLLAKAGEEAATLDVAAAALAPGGTLYAVGVDLHGRAAVRLDDLDSVLAELQALRGRPETLMLARADDTAGQAAAVAVAAATGWPLLIEGTADAAVAAHGGRVVGIGTVTTPVDRTISGPVELVGAPWTRLFGGPPAGYVAAPADALVPWALAVSSFSAGRHPTLALADVRRAVAARRLPAGAGLPLYAAAEAPQALWSVGIPATYGRT